MGYVETFGTKIQPRCRTALNEDTLLLFLSLSIYRDRPENSEICVYILENIKEILYINFNERYSHLAEAFRRLFHIL